MSEYMGDERRNTAWHVEKKLSITHMISTILIGGAVLGVYVDMSNQQVKVQAEVEYLDSKVDQMDVVHSDRMDRNKQDQKEAVNKMDRNFEQIQQKLDRLIERELNGK